MVEPFRDKPFVGGSRGDSKLYAAITKVLIEARARVPERDVPVNKPIDDLLCRYGNAPELRSIASVNSHVVPVRDEIRTRKQHCSSVTSRAAGAACCLHVAPT